MSADLGPGTRVKCINGDWNNRQDGCTPFGPAVGTVWTVNWVGYGANSWPRRRRIGLKEWLDQSECFNPGHFVPLDGNEDLSVLTGLLDKIRTPELV